MQVADENTTAVANESENQTNELLRRVSLAVSAESIATAMKAELIKASKTVRVNGFRKGKVPLNIVEQQYGASILQDTFGKLMYRAYAEYIAKENILPAGDPSFMVQKFESDKDAQFDVEFEVYPEVKLQNLDTIKIEKKVAEVLESDVDDMLNTLRKQQSTWKEIDAAATDTSRVTIDFVGEVDGEKFEGGKAEGFILLMGENRMIPGFESQIVGKKAGDKFEINVTFPEDYQAENLKGKAAKFDTTLIKVEERELPELTAQFIKRFGVKDGTIESLRVEVAKNMARELKAVIRNNVKTQIFDGLLENHSFSIPKAVLQRQIDSVRKQAMERFGNMKMDPASLPDSLFTEQAKRRASIGILLTEAIKEFELTVDENLVNTMVTEIASAYENPADVIKHYQKNKDLMNEIRNIALEQQAVDAIEAKAQVTEVPSSFSELLKQNPNMGM
ncbi:trigger factor [Thorsellia anophelis]|uniref:Trigger factor n=1 Tax=Thorsellia anophelis DSM 18579 TaxID=1123402 RepID=A0A1I0ANI9_9GAMM|nr:trigger factor [Thorsellia anophelis]SES95878.1 trigger factor [Thorsellia anophelis DSM 18579]